MTRISDEFWSMRVHRETSFKGTPNSVGTGSLASDMAVKIVGDVGSGKVGAKEEEKGKKGEPL